MKKPDLRRILGSLVILGFLLSSCTQKAGQKTERLQKTDAQATARIETSTLGSTSNVHKYSAFYLAGQPSKADFEEVKKAGIKTVINLRMPEELSFDERQVVSDLGMSYHNLGIGSPDMMTDPLFNEIREILSNAENQPVLLHCGSANRVGAIWLAFQALDGGLSIEAALAEAKTVGLRNPAMEAKAKDYVERNK